MPLVEFGVHSARRPRLRFRLTRPAWSHSRLSRNSARLPCSVAVRPFGLAAERRRRTRVHRASVAEGRRRGDTAAARHLPSPGFHLPASLAGSACGASELPSGLGLQLPRCGSVSCLRSSARNRFTRSVPAALTQQGVAGDGTPLLRWAGSFVVLWGGVPPQNSNSLGDNSLRNHSLNAIAP